MQADTLQNQLSKSAHDFRSNKIQISLQRLDQLIYEKPYEITPYLNKSSILASINQMQEAEIILKKAIEINPYDYRLHYNMFVIHFRTQSWSPALSSLRYTLSALNLIRIKQNQKEQQIYLNKSKDFWRQNLSTYVLAAVFYTKNDDIIKAIDWVSNGIEQIGEENRLLCIRASLYVKKGLINQAIRDLQVIEQCSVVNYKEIDEEVSQLGEQECKNEVISLVKEMKIIFAQINESVSSRMYSFPQNVLFLQNSVSSFDFDSIIQEHFPPPHLNTLKSTLPLSQEYPKLPSHEQVLQKNQSSSKSQKVFSTNPDFITQENQKQEQAQIHIVSPIQLYPLSCFRKVQVRIKKANLTNDTELIGKMDPYIIVTYSDNQQHQTKIIKGGGTIPEWEDDSKIYILAKKPALMKFEVWDHQTFKRDDFVGKGNLELKSTGEQTVQILSGKKDAGEIYIQVVGLE